MSQALRRVGPACFWIGLALAAPGLLVSLVVPIAILTGAIGVPDPPATGVGLVLAFGFATLGTLLLHQSHEFQVRGFISMRRPFGDWARIAMRLSSILLLVGFLIALFPYSLPLALIGAFSWRRFRRVRLHTWVVRLAGTTVIALGLLLAVFMTVSALASIPTILRTEGAWAPVLLIAGAVSLPIGLVPAAGISLLGLTVLLLSPNGVGASAGHEAGNEPL